MAGDYNEWLARLAEPTPPVLPEQDPPEPGYCVIGHAAERTWVVPSGPLAGNRYCARHLHELLRRAGWPWQRLPEL